MSPYSQTQLSSLVLLSSVLSVIFFPSQVFSTFPPKYRGIARGDPPYGSKIPPQYPEFPPRPRGGYSGCDELISQETAWFASPKYPLNYESNTNCVYTIEKYSLDVCQIEFTFEDFDLEDSLPSCDADYLELGDGSRLCGALISDFRREYDEKEKSSLYQGSAIFSSRHFKIEGCGRRRGKTPVGRRCRKQLSIKHPYLVSSFFLITLAVVELED